MCGWILERGSLCVRCYTESPSKKQRNIVLFLLLFFVCIHVLEVPITEISLGYIRKDAVYIYLISIFCIVYKGYGAIWEFSLSYAGGIVTYFLRLYVCSPFGWVWEFLRLLSQYSCFFGFCSIWRNKKGRSVRKILANVDGINRYLRFSYPNTDAKGLQI